MGLECTNFIAVAVPQMMTATRATRRNGAELSRASRSDPFAATAATISPGDVCVAGQLSMISAPRR
jgi:hypothetical protein